MHWLITGQPREPTVLGRVDCNIKIELVEGRDLLAEVVNLDIAKPLTEPQLVWERAAQKNTRTNRM